jgi:hypothetical protein
MIDGKVVGKITRGEKGPWKSQLPVKVKKGVKHTLALHTYGSPEPDDFLFRGVQVRSFQGATVTPLGEPRISSEKIPSADSAGIVEQREDENLVLRYSREAPCGVYGSYSGWRPDSQSGKLLLSVGSGRVLESECLVRLPRGYWKDTYFRVRDLLQARRSVHRMDFRVGSKEGHGWSFSLQAPGQSTSIQASHLWGKDTDPLVLLPGWNRLRVHYCLENLIWIQVGDKVIAKAVQGGAKTVDFTVRVQGIELELSDRPGS